MRCEIKYLASLSEALTLRFPKLIGGKAKQSTHRRRSADRQPLQRANVGIRSMTPAAVRDRLLEALRVDLVGPALPDELLDQNPTCWYLTGFLAPLNASLEQRSDLDANDEPDLLDEARQRSGLHPAQTQRSVRAALSARRRLPRLSADRRDLMRAVQRFSRPDADRADVGWRGGGVFWRFGVSDGGLRLAHRSGVLARRKPLLRLQWSAGSARAAPRIPRGGMPQG